MMDQKSSFQKKGRHTIISIPGTKPSFQNSLLLTSTGIASLDSLFGGGLPVGTVMLIEEDAYVKYSQVVIKLYLAQGVMSKHFIHVASLNEDPSDLFHELPVLSKTIKLEDVKKLSSSWKAEQIASNVNDRFQFLSPIYSSLLQGIKETIVKRDVLVNAKKAECNLLRIVVNSIMSSMWHSSYNEVGGFQGWREVTSFFTILKSIIRGSYSVALFTIPSNIASDYALMSRLYEIADFSIKLESFHGSDKEVNPLYKDYDGLLYIKRFASVNSFVPPKIHSLEWAFTLTKNSLLIKHLHLPPDLSSNINRNEEDKTAASQSNCAGEKLPSILDF